MLRTHVIDVAGKRVPQEPVLKGYKSSKLRFIQGRDEQVYGL